MLILFICYFLRFKHESNIYDRIVNVLFILSKEMPCLIQMVNMPNVMNGLSAF